MPVHDKVRKIAKILLNREDKDQLYFRSLTKKYSGALPMQQSPQELRAVAEGLWQESPLYAYVNRKETVDTVPYYLYIEITNVCNIKCIHCPNLAAERKKGFMAFESYKRIIDDISRYVPRVNLAKQGEPLLCKDLIKMVEYAKGKGLKVDLFTNGTLLDAEKSRQLIEAGLDYVMITCGGDKGYHEKVHQKSDFNRVVKNVNEMIKIRKTLKSKTPRIECQFIAYPFTTRQERSNFERLTKKDMKVDAPIYLDLIYYAGVRGDMIPEDYNPETTTFPVCIYPWQLVGIDWNGDVIPCVFDANAQFVVGNVNEASLRDIWNGEKMRQFRKRLINKNFHAFKRKNDLCGVCSSLWNPAKQNMTLFSTYPHRDRVDELFYTLLQHDEADLDIVYAKGLLFLLLGRANTALKQLHKIITTAPFSDLASKAKKNYGAVVNSGLITAHEIPITH